jgi:hypothetical protein
MKVLQNLKLELLYDAAIPLPAMYPKKSKPAYKDALCLSIAFVLVSVLWVIFWNMWSSGCKSLNLLVLINTNTHHITSHDNIPYCLPGAMEICSSDLQAHYEKVKDSRQDVCFELCFSKYMYKIDSKIHVVNFHISLPLRLLFPSVFSTMCFKKYKKIVLWM